MAGPIVSQCIPILIAAAHWAGREFELSQNLKVTLVPHPRATNLVMNLSSDKQEPRPGIVEPMPPSEALQEACADAVGVHFLHILVRRGVLDDKARIEFLLRSGVSNGKFISYTGIKVLYQLSCKVGRDVELLEALADNLEVLLAPVIRTQCRDAIQWFQALRDRGLLGPLALSLRIVLFSKREQIIMRWHAEYEDMLEFLESIEELFKE